MSNSYPKTTIDTTEFVRRMNDKHNTRPKTKLTTFGKGVIAAVAGGVLATGLLANAHNRDDALFEQQAKAEQAATIVVGVSSETTNPKAKAGDTVSSMVRDNSDVVNNDPENVQDYVAFDAAVKEVEALPENAEVLSDNTLQIGERLVIPTEIKVTTEAQINENK